ncbi:MMPL family transporter [Tessaracoccus sp. OH4464_COT-324]|uniref:MMPL family transporter n=1 Tax=Tessaracoccus sp. OH4464_COT-324 TaxID=2491059 RepID=UPI000F632FCD|nr:MMPL family transporter [Tessaracoccus sp. OH4464_COT-324]RRD45290.1 MMPL family transporter [Tessaracoccus sp. OH4464_COT-324]
MKILRITVATICLLIWLAISGFGGPTFGKLSDVTSNDQSTFLPASAESTRAADLAAKFDTDEVIPAVVVAELGQALEPSQLAGLDDLRSEIDNTGGVTRTIGPIPNDERTAVQYIALIDTQDFDAREVVADLRATLADAPRPDGVAPDTTFHVTGPAGFSADLAAAFSGIDGLLLVVTLAVVLVILVIVYRSILLPLLVIFTSMAALCAAILAIYWMARWEWIALNGQAQGILSILVIGATTDYALLLVARHREELATTKGVFDAMRKAVTGSLDAISASAATVAVALLCLLVSDLNSNKSLGPIAATGIAFAWGASLTLLPALLYLFGRAAYWPARPAYQGEQAAAETRRGVWWRIAGVVERRPRTIWVVTALLLLLGAAWLPTLRAEGVASSDLILGQTDAKRGQRILNDHFDAGTGSPTSIFVHEEFAQQAADLVAGLDGVGAVTLTAEGGQPAGIPPQNLPPKVVDSMVYLQATLTSPADSAEAETTVVSLRQQLRELDADTLVGGTTATAIDSNATAERDLWTIIPLVLGVVLLILMVLLRSILLPVLLMAATILSFGTAMGTAAIVFNHILGFPGADPAVPLYGFVFLVALGIDYTIFLMTRAREETPTLGTCQAVLKSLAVTGGVITSAGVVLAATFAALAVIPLMFMVQLAFIVAYGVLIDTLIVRTLLIPGLVLDVGAAVWWPFTRRIEPSSAIE